MKQRQILHNEGKADGMFGVTAETKDINDYIKRMESQSLHTFILVALKDVVTL